MTLIIFLHSITFQLISSRARARSCDSARQNPVRMFRRLTTLRDSVVLHLCIQGLCSAAHLFPFFRCESEDLCIVNSSNSHQAASHVLYPLRRQREHPHATSPPKHPKTQRPSIRWHPKMCRPSHPPLQLSRLRDTYPCLRETRTQTPQSKLCQRRR